MKIGILTFHRAINYGAVMQAYSLLTRLQKEFPEDEVEIIDYNSMERELFKIKCPIIFCYRRSLQQGIQKIRQTLSFRKALKRLNFSKSMLGASDMKVGTFMSKQYDVIVVGSDAVFNWNDIGIPNPYFLSNTNVKHKLSYAASSHLQKYRNITPEQKNYLHEALANFSYIGVRDESSRQFVEYVLNEGRAVHNCDPTIFLNMDFDEMDLLKKLRRHKFDFQKKTVFVMLMKPEYGRFVREYFGEDTQIVALMDGNKYADCYLYDLNPFEWAKVFRYGSFLVTDYFHGTILCLKNNVPVLSIDSSRYGNDGTYESKASDLLRNRLKMPELYISAEELQMEDGYEVFSERVRRIENTFDPAVLNARIAMEQESAQSFIDALRELHD